MSQVVKRFVKRAKDGTAVPVDAILVKGVKGIFLNRDLGLRTRWVITHRGSGLRVGTYRFFSVKDATAVAQELTRVKRVDWTIKDAKVLVNAHPGLDKAVEKVIKRLEVKHDKAD